MHTRRASHGSVRPLNCGVMRHVSSGALTKDDAASRVLERINQPDPYWPNRSPLALIEAETIERAWGWVFFYSLTDGTLLVGNAPLIVNRLSGEIIETGTALPIEAYVDRYESTLRLEQSEKTRCDECRSDYFAHFSYMAALCPECAHLLYGYPECVHEFVGDRCRLCFWDGSRSEYTKNLGGAA
jgi:hypothetical protein